jgi:hypothetical protein
VVDAPAVRVLDQNGESMGGVVVAFAVGQGGGSLGSTTATTNGQGVASVGSWTLGTQAGSNTLTASVQGPSPITFQATGTAGPPTGVSFQSGAGQQAKVGEEVGTRPSVRATDAFGNPTAGVQVVFEVTAGGGQVTGGTQTTDPNGAATVGGWRMGDAVGENRLRATVPGGISTTLSATSIPGDPAALAKLAGDGQSAQVDTDVAVPPALRVRDRFGNPVPGVMVTFTATGPAAGGPARAQGSGSVEPTVVTSDPEGLVRVSRWRLGTVAGENTLTATSETLVTTFTATATAGPAASLTLVAGDGQSAPAGEAVPVRPAVQVRDAFDNPVAGVGVMFEVGSGGGSVQGAARTTGANGVATVGCWALGPTPGANTLRVLVEGLTPVFFSATGTAGGGGSGCGGGEFEITVRFLGGLTASQEAIFTLAAERWQSVIEGDLADFDLEAEEGSCSDPALPAIDEVVDDVLVFAQGVAIDGVGKILGQAGPCFIRNADGLPILGRMKFDEADLANLEASGRLLDVIIHEMGHVLGIGSLWDFAPFFELLSGRGTADPFFTGAGAIAAFDDVGGTPYAGNKVPVENSGGAGTRDSHWRESVFNSELMTGFLDGGANPLSAVTIASLEDMGYLVDPASADAYTLPPIIEAPGRDERVVIPLLELPMPRPVVVRPGVPVGRR